MATMITRTVKTYRATQLNVEIDPTQELGYKLVKGESVLYDAPSENDGLARKAFKAACITCKRGQKLVHEMVSETTYAMPLDYFIEHAEVVND